MVNPPRNAGQACPFGHAEHASEGAEPIGDDTDGLYGLLRRLYDDVLEHLRNNLGPHLLEGLPPEIQNMIRDAFG